MFLKDECEVHWPNYLHITLKYHLLKCKVTTFGAKLKQQLFHCSMFGTLSSFHLLSLWFQTGWVDQKNKPCDTQICWVLRHLFCNHHIVSQKRCQHLWSSSQTFPPEKDHHPRSERVVPFSFFWPLKASIQHLITSLINTLSGGNTSVLCDAVVLMKCFFGGMGGVC